MLRFLTALLLLLPMVAQAEVSEIRIARQPSILYLGTIIMEQQKLVEAAGASLGLPHLTAKYLTLNSGGTATDSLLAGDLEVVTSGISNMLLLWDRTKGQVKGLISGSSLPLWAVTKDPSVTTLKDLKPTDRIAVPTVKVSTQALVLQMAARKLFGDAEYSHFDSLEVTMGHPDAMTALLTGSGAITVHFSAPPYEQQEARTPGFHVIGRSNEIIGHPFSNPLYFTTTKFHDANPTVVKAFMVAAKNASAFIIAHPREAAEIYLKATGEKIDPDLVVDVIGDAKVNFDPTPVGIKSFADHMADTKVLRTRPASWKDVIFPEAHDMNGN